MAGIRLRVGPLSFSLALALALPGLAHAGVNDELQAAREAISSGDLKAADKALDRAEDAAPEEAAVLPTRVVAQLYFYRGVVEHLDGDKKGRALDHWRQTLLVDNGFQWETAVLDAQDPRAIFEALRAEVRSRPRIDSTVPEKTGAAKLYIDGQRKKAGEQVIEGEHLAQIECPDGSVHGTWTDLRKDPKWFKLCPGGVDTSVVVAEDTGGDDEWGEFGPMFGPPVGGGDDGGGMAPPDPAEAGPGASKGADAAAAKKAEEAAAAKKAEEAAAAKKAEEAAAASKAEEEAAAAKKAEEAAAAKKAEEEAAAAKKAAEEEAARKKAEEEAQRQAAEEAARLAAEEEARKKAEEEAAAAAAAEKAAAEEAARKKAAEEAAAAKKAEEEAAAAKKAEEEAAAAAAKKAEEEAAAAKKAEAAARRKAEAEAKKKAEAEAKEKAEPGEPVALKKGDAVADAGDEKKSDKKSDRKSDKKSDKGSEPPPTQAVIGGDSGLSSSRSRRGLNPVGGYLMAGGTAFLGGATAVYYTAFAPNYADLQDARDAPRSTDEDTAADLSSRHDTLRYTVLGLGGVGAAALVTGGVVLFLDDDAGLQPWVGVGSAGLRGRW